MRDGRALWSLSGSLLLHGLALAAAVALVVREPSPPILIVELGEGVRVAEPGPPAAAPRRDPSAAAPRRESQGPVGPPASLAARSLVPEPSLPAEPSLRLEHPASGDHPEPLAARPAQAPAELSTPASASIPEPVSEPSADVGRDATGSGSGAAEVIEESVTGGIPGGGPLAMLVPSGRGVGEGGVSRAATTAPGEGEGGVPAEFGPYLLAFRQRIQESLTYPLAARRRGLGGTVQLEVELLPTGRVASVVVRSSSAHAVLDQTALETVRKLQPVPFPSGVPPRPLKVRLPIVFELK